MEYLSLRHIAFAYFVIVNLVTFIIYGLEKKKKKKSKWRFSEAMLLKLAIIGGSIGAWLGMKTWHHKTMHKKFKYGIPTIIIIQLLIIIIIIYYAQTNQ